MKIKRNCYDWRKVKDKPSFPYKGLDDPKYINERDAFLKVNGNGWWWWQGLMSDDMYNRNHGINDIKPKAVKALKRKRLGRKKNG